MKAKATRLILIIILLTSGVFPKERIKEKDLPQKYNDFLNLTKYIMLPQENEVFLQLTNNRDRDIFIETFWRQRDPTPGTPENEYKEEHTKRFNYANRRYGQGTSREGWRTDMGRIYIILGPPVSIERFEATQGLYPTQVWYYYGDRRKDLPAHFGLVFFQRGGAGEYKLYDPVVDGPGNLMVHARFSDPTNYRELYETLKEIAPTLADISLSMVVGETPLDFQPSLMNAIIMADILESPKKEINPTYATHFLNYKGMVSTEYMANFMDSQTQVALIRDPDMELNFLHFSMVPKRLSVSYYEPKDQYYCDFTLDVSLRVAENVIFQYRKDFPLYFDPEEYDRIKMSGIAFEDSFPVVEGEYELVILLQNSIGKEFTIFEEKVVIPEKSMRPRILGPLLGYDFEDFEAGSHIPFKVFNKKLIVDPKKTFSKNDDISISFNVMNATESLRMEARVKVNIIPLGQKETPSKSFSLELKKYPFNKTMNVTHSMPASELSPGYYEIRLILTGRNEEIIDEKKENFVISSAETVAHPIAHAKAFPLSKRYVYYYMLAHQYEKKGDYERAEMNFEKAFHLNPEDKKGLIDYANFLFKIRKFNRCIELVENIRDDESLRFEYFLLKGKAYMGLGKYPEAIENLLEGNKIYNSDISLLNSLGFCYYRIGEKEKALSAFKASLGLNHEQADVKRLVEEIEKKK